LLLLFSDYSLPLSRLIIPKGQNIIFEGHGIPSSLILKEGISDGILEVFVLC
jgi:hypothetical protein